jgi:hypothetical protein
VAVGWAEGTTPAPVIRLVLCWKDGLGCPDRGVVGVYKGRCDAVGCADRGDVVEDCRYSGSGASLSTVGSKW